MVSSDINAIADHEKKGEKEQVHNSAIKNKIMQSLDVVGDNECNDDEAHHNEREQETSEIKNFINADDEEGSKHSAGCYECDNYECIDEKPLKDKKSKLDIAPKVGSNWVLLLHVVHVYTT